MDKTCVYLFFQTYTHLFSPLLQNYNKFPQVWKPENDTLSQMNVLSPLVKTGFVKSSVYCRDTNKNSYLLIAIVSELKATQLRFSSRVTVILNRHEATRRLQWGDVRSGGTHRAVSYTHLDVYKRQVKLKYSSKIYLN